jgi:hypothetical protein
VAILVHPLGAVASAAPPKLRHHLAVIIVLLRQPTGMLVLERVVLDLTIGGLATKIYPL